MLAETQTQKPQVQKKLPVGTTQLSLQRERALNQELL
jgi:hypothetical protein